MTMQHIAAFLPAARSAPSTRQEPPPDADADAGVAVAPCPRCGGAGWLRTSAPLDDPQFGRAVPCPGCWEPDALHERRLAHLVAGAPRVLMLTATAEEIDPAAAIVLDEWAYDLRNPTVPPFDEPLRRRHVTLAGPTGTGKTAAAVVFARSLAETGMSVLFTTAAAHLDRLRRTFDDEPGALTLDAIERRARTVDLLVLDDLGAENPTAWAAERLTQLVDARQASDRPTLITTNMHPDRAPRDRLWSRVFATTAVRVVVLSGPDRRRSSPCRPTSGR